MARSEAQKRADKKYDAKRKGKRTRNWAFLMYPESCVTDWQERLTRRCVPCFVSPLHDQDTWTAYDEQENEAHKQGEPKKAHYHDRPTGGGDEQQRHAGQQRDERGRDMGRDR